MPFTRVLSAQFSARTGSLGRNPCFVSARGFLSLPPLLLFCCFKGSLLWLFPYHRNANMVQGKGLVSCSTEGLQALFSGDKIPSVFVAWGNAMPGLHPPALQSNGCSSFSMRLSWPLPLLLTVGAKASRDMLPDHLGKALFTI